VEEDKLDLVRVFKALGNETRLAIFNYIRGPEYDCDSNGRDECADECNVDTTERTVCVSHVARKFPSMGQAAISQHLKCLHQAGLLERHKAGPWVYYTISAPTVSLIREFFESSRIAAAFISTPEKSTSRSTRERRERRPEATPLP
jgi:DNA-binding transcriptional ArsR family regulator